MSFNYDYALIQKIRSISAGGSAGLGLLFAIRTLNFATFVINDNYKEYESTLQKLQIAIEQEFGYQTFRYNHDTFFLILEPASPQNITGQTLQEINNRAGLKYQSFIIGYSEIDGGSVNSVISKALVASDIATQENKNMLSFQESLPLITKYNNSLENFAILYEAIVTNNLYLIFQPIANVTEQDPFKEIFCYEALLRIKTLDNKQVNNESSNSNIIINNDNINDVLKAGENTELIFLTDEYILKNAIKIIQDYNISLLIGLSSASISNINWVEKAFNLLKDSLSAASNLIIGINESSLFQDYEKILEFIFKCKAIGCQITLNNFNPNSYLSFIQLEKLPIDFISFNYDYAEIRLEDKGFKLFLEAIMKIAKNYGIKIIVKSIENEESLNFFKDLNVDYMQGNYLYSAETSVVRSS